MMRIIVTFLIAFISIINLKGEERHDLAFIMNEIRKNPEAISNYSTKTLVRRCVFDDERRKWINLITYINPTSIRRSTIKKYFLPLCESILAKYYDDSELLQTIANGRDFPQELLSSKDSVVSGRNIVERLSDYQNVLKVTKFLRLDNTDIPISYGSQRYMERFLWGETSYMDSKDPIPDSLQKEVQRVFDVDLCSVDTDLIKLLLPHSNDADFLVKNAEILMRASTYLPFNQMQIIWAYIGTAFINKSKQEEISRLFENELSFRLGDKAMERFSPLVQYTVSGSIKRSKEANFKEYRDSLLSQGCEYAKYLPNCCPEELMKSPGFNEYLDRYYNYMSFVFDNVLPYLQDNNSKFWSGFQDFGCRNQTEFLKLYIYETLDAHSFINGFGYWGRIEKIMQYFENNILEIPLYAIEIAESYAHINPKRSRDFVRNVGIRDFLNDAMTFQREYIKEDHLAVAAALAYIYSLLRNDLRYPTIRKYIDWVEENYDILKLDKVSVVFDVASALNLMGEYELSDSWLDKINKGEESDPYMLRELSKLRFRNHYGLERSKDMLKEAEYLQVRSLTDEFILMLIFAKLDQHDTKDMSVMLERFTQSLSETYNTLLYFNTDDQDWAHRKVKRNYSRLLESMLSEYGLLEFIHDDIIHEFKPLVGAILYNWALASKGALLRSQKLADEKIISMMSPEEYSHFKKMSAVEEEDYSDGSTYYLFDIAASVSARSILLDFVRENASDNLPKFDFNDVKSQLKTNDIAIELIRLNSSYYVAAMLRQDWDYPQFVELSIDTDDDPGVLLWQKIKPYLLEGQKIYISPDGLFNFENIELAKDSAGVDMADKYRIYRVSTTLHLPEDVYLSDIAKAVAYGNLTYDHSDYDAQTDTDIDHALGFNKKRATVMGKWVNLPESETELSCIQGIMDAHDIPCYIYRQENGDKKTFLALSADSVSMLHLATHGFYNKADSQDDEEEIPAMKRAGIVLSNSKYDSLYSKNSGSVFANEIANLDLNSVKLLVLSACETAKGDLDDDGVFGLQRAFKQAGVGCIIMTLDAVNSYITNELMTHFYLYLEKGNSVRDAFRLAQKQITQKYSTDECEKFIILD